MGRNVLVNDTKIAEFTRKYIPKELSWRHVAGGEDPLSATYELGPKDYPINTTFFREVGLQLPLWPLLVDFLMCTHVMLNQLIPNVIRIIRGRDALNKINGTNLGLEELKFCYSLSKGSYGYSLSAGTMPLA